MRSLTHHLLMSKILCYRASKPYISPLERTLVDWKNRKRKIGASYQDNIYLQRVGVNRPLQKIADLFWEHSLVPLDHAIRAKDRKRVTRFTSIPYAIEISTQISLTIVRGVRVYYYQTCFTSALVSRYEGVTHWHTMCVRLC